MKNRNRINNIAYIAEAAIEYFITLLIQGAFLATLLKQSGVSDKMTGILSSLVSLACIAQMFTSVFVRSHKRVKITVTLFHFANELMFLFLYVIPSINVSQTAKTALFALMILGGYILSYIVNPSKIVWMMSFVPDSERGKFTANKEIVSLLGGMLFTYLMGALVDRYKALGDEKTGFILCGITIFVLSVFHIITLLIVEPPKYTEKIDTVKEKGVYLSILSNKNFKKIITIDIVWKCALYFSSSYYGVYQTQELGFSLKFISVLSMIASFSRVLVSRPVGRYADKTSWANMLSMVFFISGISFIFAAFAVPSNGIIFYSLYTVIHAISMAGINGGLMNVTFDYVPADQRSAALGIKTACGGVAGFLASMAGGELLEHIQSSNNTFLGINVYAQQVLSAISALVTILLVIYVRKVILNLKVVKSE